jgi:hypothetical protein
MRLCVSICTALIAAVFALPAQTRLENSEHPTAPHDAQRGTNHQADTPVPAARYSPLAAQGGYAGGRSSPLDAVVHALNPRDVNLGEIWERRRRQWLDNAGANPYFWFAADNDSKDLQVKRLQEELDRETQELTDIAKRIEQAEQRLNARAKVASSVDAQTKLAERINRLETENRTLGEENRRLRQRSGNNKAVAVDEQNRPEES